MDKRVLNRINKRLGTLQGLRNDLNQLSGSLINKIEDPALKAKVRQARAEAQKGNKAPAEQLLKDLKNER